MKLTKQIPRVILKEMISLALLIPYIWFIVLLLQSFGKLKFGQVPISPGWVVLNVILFSALVLSAYSKAPYTSSLQKLITPFFIYIFTFNLIYIYDLYSESLIYNRLEHLVGSFLVCYLCYIFLNNFFEANNIILNRTWLVVFSLITSMALGAFAELVELFLDYFLHEKNIGPGLWDTNLDLLMNFSGSAMMFIVLLFL